MLRNCVVLINDKKQPIAILDIKTFKDDKSYHELKEKAEKNYAKEVEEKNELIGLVKDLRYEVVCLKAQIKYDHGEITKEEYERIIVEGK